MFHLIPTAQAAVRLPDFNATQDLGGFISSLYTFALTMAGLAVFIRFFWAGWLYLASAGNSTKVGEAKKIMWNAVIGVILLFSAYLLLYVINPDLVKCSFKLGGVGSGGSCGDIVAGGDNPGGNGDNNNGFGGGASQSYSFTVDSLQPNQGVAGIEVMINGSNFVAGMEVQWNGNVLPGGNVVDSGRILFKVPADAEVGPNEIRVTYRGKTSDPKVFTVGGSGASPGSATRYACENSQCVVKAGGSYTTNTCDNRCVTQWPTNHQIVVALPQELVSDCIHAGRASDFHLTAEAERGFGQETFLFINPIGYFPLRVYSSTSADLHIDGDRLGQGFEGDSEQSFISLTYFFSGERSSDYVMIGICRE